MTPGESFVSVCFRFFMLLIPLLAAAVKDRFVESRKHLEINHLYDARNGPSQRRIGTALWVVSGAIKVQAGGQTRDRPLYPNLLKTKDFHGQ
jgi:hypothetical protein